MHVAVAPACNIQCHYCNRKYDCANESRPGVVFELLNSDQAVKKVMAVATNIPQMTVLGIAGPGDPLANPERTFPTFRELTEKAPDIKLCVSTNGLNGHGKEAMQALADGVAQTWPPYTYPGRPVEHPSGYVVDTLPAVFQCLFSKEDFKSVLVAVVNRGGDADTTGAIAGMLAGALYGAGALPLRWLRALDPKVSAQCEDHACQLLSLAPNQHL